MNDLIHNSSLLGELKVFKYGKKSISIEEAEEFSKKNPDTISTDAFIYISIFRRGLEVHKGSKNITITSFDGFTGGEIPSSEILQSCFHMIKALSEDPTIESSKREILKSLHKINQIAHQDDLTYQFWTEYNEMISKLAKKYFKG